MGPGNPRRSAGPRPGHAGWPGFEEDGFALAPGRVLGVRQWTTSLPPLHDDPLTSDWVPAPMTGMTGQRWETGTMEARCNYDPEHQPPVDLDEAGRECGCGVWAYWKLQGITSNPVSQLPVAGVVEGTGRVLIGPRGFRCQRARIVGLALPFVIQAQIGVPLARMGDALPPEQEAELAAARDRANAWMAVIQVRLADAYPEAQVFATVRGLLAAYPPGEKMR